MESEFGAGNSWKLKFAVRESPGIYMWFKLTHMHLAEFGLLLTESENEFRNVWHSKYKVFPLALLTKQFLCNLR